MEGIKVWVGVMYVSYILNISCILIKKVLTRKTTTVNMNNIMKNFFNYEWIFSH